MRVRRIVSYLAMTITATFSVLANPQGEAIHAGTLDCYTLRVRKDGSCKTLRVRREGVADASSCSLFALLKAA
jgi:hypothetical protein